MQSSLQIIHSSDPQQHSFNFPYQIGSRGDSPDKALTEVHKVKLGDVLILGTDGLFDNVYKDEMREIVEKRMDTGRLDPNRVARELAQKAFEYSKDKKYYSPFEDEARKAGRVFKGGKQDDISVIVAQVLLWEK